MAVRQRRFARLSLMALTAGCLGGSAMAHTSERGHIMLLPTELYVLGGAGAVAVSVLLVALLPFFHWAAPRSGIIDIAALSPPRRVALSLFSLLGIAVLIASGLRGPPDPVANPLPGTIWTLWWSGFTALTILLGNLWPALNPWSGLHDLLRRTGDAPLRYPPWLGQWPAVILFFGFAWFELIYPTPFDPQRLAIAMTAYAAVTFAGLALMGRDWLLGAECFSVYFRMLGWLSPMQWQERGGRLKLAVVLPGAGLLRAGPQPAGNSAFILLALSAVSFDGFMRTFFWAAMLGVNPLEYPGRSAMVLANSLGLAVMFMGLATAYWLAVRLGGMLARLPQLKGLVISIVPIAFAYHLAHYLPGFPVVFLQTVKAWGDPFGTGLDLFGWTRIQPPSSMMMDYAAAGLVYRAQTAIIVVGHVISVLAAHVLMTGQAPSPRQSALALVPLNALMVLYTVFGLWLLSTPVVG